MSVESAADRAMFMADFGETLTWWVGVVPSPVLALPHLGSTRIDAEDGAGIVNARATMQLPAESLPVGAATGNQVELRSVAYVVKSIEPDGTGMLVVLLEEDLSEEVAGAAALIFSIPENSQYIGQVV